MITENEGFSWKRIEGAPEAKELRRLRKENRQLKLKGFEVGRKRAATLMKKAEVEARAVKKFRHTTQSLHEFPVAKNLLNREFDVK